ncbi:hypothetical protein [Alginatibacterium sediminis]|nr:hypothetical protein [Alginatibacterium sediminis]
MSISKSLDAKPVLGKIDGRVAQVALIETFISVYVAAIIVSYFIPILFEN